MSASPSRRWLLALHSSSDTLGIGLQPLAVAEAPLEAPRLEAFQIGRAHV